jgi:hypothetical protein
MVYLAHAVDRVSVAPAQDAEQAAVVAAGPDASRLAAAPLAFPSVVAAPYVAEEPDVLLVRAGRPALDVVPEPDAFLVRVGQPALDAEPDARPVALVQGAVALAALLAESALGVVAELDALLAESAWAAAAPEPDAQLAARAPAVAALARDAALEVWALAAAVVQVPDVVAARALQDAPADYSACSAEASGLCSEPAPLPQVDGLLSADAVHCYRPGPESRGALLERVVPDESAGLLLPALLDELARAAVPAGSAELLRAAPDVPQALSLPAGRDEQSRSAATAFRCGQLQKPLRREYLVLPHPSSLAWPLGDAHSVR